jgi:hypothetical protein
MAGENCAITSIQGVAFAVLLHSDLSIVHQHQSVERMVVAFQQVGRTDVRGNG